MSSVFTSESVCAGHPDKLCDRISDAVLDAALAVDPLSRVAVETMVTRNFIALAGEVTTSARLNYRAIARRTVRELGYGDPALHFTDRSPVVVKIHTQSPEIAQGVDQDGAGDQGMMFGYACRDTASFMPLPITLAHALAQSVDQARESAVLPYLRPDGKTQVSVRYENGKPKEVTQVVVAVPHRPEIPLEQVKRDLYQKVVRPVLTQFKYRIPQESLVVNGTGVWHIGGPASDTGVTGRKIIVDTYGGMARVGGGAFSGKDPTKVDRSGAYAARYLAKHVVAHELADRCEVRLAYYIGAPRPVMVEAETFGTARATPRAIRSFMSRLMHGSVAEILEKLQLRQPLYVRTAAYGHFGRDGFPWEQVASHA